ncbi:MAG: hypothetical protein QJR09_06090 [Micrococcus sp.]|nr:hypothetical protein [Micrococcus sp.]
MPLLVTAFFAPLAVAPAQASTTLRGCTVTPLRPSVNLNAGTVVFRFEATCSAGRTIRVQGQGWEEDRGADQKLTNRHTFPNRNYKKYETHTFRLRTGIPNTEAGDEEVYSQVRFRVYRGDTWSNWTDWESSPVRVIDQR